MNRLFLSLPVTLDDYQGLQKELSPLLQGRWVPENNLHLTLAFFGDRYGVDELQERLSTIDLSLQPSVIKGLGLFRRKKILYAQTENPSLFKLHKRLRQSFGLYTEDFVPHITLIRIKKVLDEKELKKKLVEKENEVLGRLEPSVQLISSELQAQGAIYTCVKSYPIKADI